ncbi:MAG: methyltransferase domain-containing protein [Bacilli bacterium]|nr:methyltransferase domain-containing protein [Bacilli bacterium]
MLICPKCKKQLQKENHIYRCENNHSYDISKYNYVNLLLSHPKAGDNKLMINARNNFLEAGYYQPLADLISTKINIINPVILDCGCGTGFYLNSLFSQFNGTFYGIDISKFAIEKAARKNKDITYIVASSSNIPLKNRSVDILMNVFAPYFNDEFFRVLKNDGLLIVVSANTNHLFELKKVLYAEPYLNNDKEYLLSSFIMVDEEKLEYKINIKTEDINNLYKMTPYFYRTSSSDYAKLSLISSLEITVSFTIRIYKKRF